MEGVKGAESITRLFKDVCCKNKEERKESSQFGSREGIRFSFKKGEACHGYYYCMDLIKGKY